jgi:photolyase PhrII
MTRIPNSRDSVAALPEWLKERCRPLNDKAIETRGEFVLYWMHHAVRGHENPALDVATTLGNRIGLPVLVYQGLGGNHRYDNDRHHSFILQGARDAHRELRDRGARAVSHLDRAGGQSSPLRRLVARASAFVVEDFPAPPFPRWTGRLARHAPVAVVAVDCSCIVPMQSQPKRFTRAFDFRRHNRDEFERRVPLPWTDVEPTQPAFDGELGFEPLDLGQADIAELCASCDIDHSIPPVAHTVGGSVAGYARWRRFLQSGLAAYARERNDAAIEWPRGVSRLSAYIHHGQVSPFRIAREARQRGGDGAEKFLDELLIWRELAFNFCFFTDDPEVMAALPGWAGETLQEHAQDPRPKILDPEALARSQTGDVLWDLAQTSLRIHGELHNNLRMTWAKAIVPWRPDPEAALATLIELNHRYALDGSDPSSYGGLLWTLGLFDRPFPDLPITGKLRSRSTKSHARRLDLERFRRRITQPSTGHRMRIAIIGAGISGLTAARTLQDQGHRVTVFEKSRGPGGRAATRRINELQFDHGAQYFTARDPAFQRAVAAWRERGLVMTWNGRIGRVRHDRIEPADDEQERFVGVPGMSAIGKHLATNLTLRTGVRVAPPQRLDGGWRLRSDTGETLGDFDLLIVAVPAPQAAVLLGSFAPDLAARAASVRYAAVWALMLAVDTDPGLPYDGLFFDGDEIGWAARNSSKPSRSGNTWVVHAAPAWTRSRCDEPGEEIAAELGNLFAGRVGIDATDLVVQTAHLWRYSLVDYPLATGALWNPELRLGLCGDWCQGARIEGAFLSGQAIAGRILGYLANVSASEFESSPAERVAGTA